MKWQLHLRCRPVAFVSRLLSYKQPSFGSSCFGAMDRNLSSFTDNKASCAKWFITHVCLQTHSKANAFKEKSSGIIYEDILLFLCNLWILHTFLDLQLVHINVSSTGTEQAISGLKKGLVRESRRFRSFLIEADLIIGRCVSVDESPPSLVLGGHNCEENELFKSKQEALI